MKKTNSIRTTFSTLSAIALMTLLTSGNPVYSADIETNDVTRLCKVSKRGTRCKLGNDVENTITLNNFNSLTSVSTCTKSSRGMRCKLNGYSNLIIADVEVLTSIINQLTAIIDQVKCKKSPRGNRCKATLS